MRVLVNYTPKGQKPEDLEKHLNYIMDEKKTLGKYIYCYRCNKEDPLSDMKFVKKLYKKDRGRQYISYMQSFMSYDEVTPEQVMRLGIQMAKFFKDYQSVTCVHVDTDRIHYHTLLNPVNLTNGKKLRLGKNAFTSSGIMVWRPIMNKICRGKLTMTASMTGWTIPHETPMHSTKR